MPTGRSAAVQFRDMRDLMKGRMEAAIILRRMYMNVEAASVGFFGEKKSTYPSSLHGEFVLFKNRQPPSQIVGNTI